MQFRSLTFNLNYCNDKNSDCYLFKLYLPSYKSTWTTMLLNGRSEWRGLIIASVLSRSKIKFSKILQPWENPILKTSNTFSEVVASEMSCNDSANYVFRYLQAEDCGIKRCPSTALVRSYSSVLCQMTFNLVPSDKINVHYSFYYIHIVSMWNCRMSHIARCAAVVNLWTSD